MNRHPTTRRGDEREAHIYTLRRLGCPTWPTGVLPVARDGGFDVLCFVGRWRLVWAMNKEQFLKAFAPFGFEMVPSDPDRLVGFAQGRHNGITLEIWYGLFTIEMEHYSLRRTVCCLQGFSSYDEIVAFIRKNRLLCLELRLPVHP